MRRTDAARIEAAYRAVIADLAGTPGVDDVTTSSPEITVIVWMEPDATDDELAAIERRIDADARVTESTYVDQEAAFADFRDLFENRPEMIETVEPEDLPSSFRVTLAADAPIQEVVDAYAADEGVYDVTRPMTELLSIARDAIEERATTTTG
ncbi:MAG: permease-like cell division protein FtsX [Actinomycetota bacterium]|nr:permease-like cell division protein FtsX [Actinomycetota bacterium]